MKIKFKKVKPNAIVPRYATSGAAGMDLCACIDHPVIIGRGDRMLIFTGLAVELPSAEYVALVYPRSGLASKHGITLANCVGVIDSDYRGEIGVCLYNTGEPYTINPGDRIVQLVITPVAQPEIEEVDELSDTVRGMGGFGSTGRN